MYPLYSGSSDTLVSVLKANLTIFLSLHTDSVFTHYYKLLVSATASRGCPLMEASTVVYFHRTQSVTM